MGLHLSYDTRYFDRATMDAMLARFRGFLVALAHGLEGPVEPLLDAGADDPEQVLRHNRTQVGHDLSTGYVAQFEARVDRHPERIAASCEARSWTYRELDGHANRPATASSRPQWCPTRPWPCWRTATSNCSA